MENYNRIFPEFSQHLMLGFFLTPALNAGIFQPHKPTTPINILEIERRIPMSESMLRSIICTAIGHFRAGKFEFWSFNLHFTIEPLQRTPNTYAIMAETPNPFCVAHITG